MIKVKGKVYKTSDEITNERSQWYQILCYEESENCKFDDIWSLVQEIAPDYIAIRHDKDLNEDGSLKKPHYHIVYGLPSNQLWRSQLSFFSNIGMPWQFLQPVAIPKKAIRYLIHLDDEDKFQYKRNELIGNIDFSQYGKGDSTESDLNFIMRELRSDDNTIFSMTDLTMYCLNNGYIGTLKQYQYLLSRVINEISANRR